MKKIFNCLIVDDEPLARKGLAIRLNEHDDINVVEQCGNARAALQFLQNNTVDIVFLDIQMPGLTGFEMINEAIKLNIALPSIIFVTAFDEFALKAFEVHAVDYLLKPANEERLAQSLEKFRHTYQYQQDSEHKQKLVQLVSDVTGNNCEQILTNLENNQSLELPNYADILAIKDGSEVTRVPIKEIIWIDAAGDYMCVHTAEATHILRQTMKQLEQTLDPKQFIRTHRSVIVNHHFINKLCSQINGEYYLVLKNGKELKVSRSYKDKVKQLITA